jgi:hypothetical protein
MIQVGDLIVIYIHSENNPLDMMTKNVKEALFVKHAVAMKNGVLFIGKRNREDVVGDVATLVYEVRRSDSNQFLCVLLPSGKHRRRCDCRTMLGIDDKPLLGINCKCNSEASMKDRFFL